MEILADLVYELNGFAQRTRDVLGEDSGVICCIADLMARLSHARDFYASFFEQTFKRPVRVTTSA